MELVTTEDKALLAVAESLLLRILEEYPEDNFNRSSVLHTLGDIYKIRNDYETALNFYKQSLDFETVYPNVITESYLDFSELTVKLKKAEHFSIVEEMLEKKFPNELFPVSRYKIALILAAINKYKGSNDKAEYYIKVAEENANATTSGLRYHKQLGLVKKRDGWLERLLGK
jgi:tetratricopeptide (TPR) repeat protein